MKRYRQYIHLDVKLWVLAILLIVAQGILSIFGIYTQSIVVNLLLEQSPFLLTAILGLLVLMIVTQLTSCANSIVSARLIKKWMLYLGGRISENISVMGYKNYHSIKHGEYISWYTSDLERAYETYFRPFLSVIGQVTLSIISLAMLLFISVKVFVLSLVLYVVLSVVSPIFGKRVGASYQALAGSSARFTNTLQEYTSAYDVLKNFKALKLLKEQIQRSEEGMGEDRYRAHKYMALAVLAFQGTQKVFEGIMFAFVLYLVSQGELSLGMVVSVPTILSIFMSSTTNILELRTQSRGMSDIIDKLETLQTVKVYQYENVEHLSLQKVSFSYSDKTILEEADYRFEQGKKYAILGASGSGKSTLVKLLLGRLAPQAGQVLIGDQILDTELDTEFSGQIAYLSQEGFIFDLTIRENITLDQVEIDDETIYQALKTVKLYDYVMSLPDKLDTVLGMAGGRMSGGEKQRLSLARALVRQTPVLIMDEATSAIDKETAVAIEEEILKDPNRMVIMISHHLDPRIAARLDTIIEIEAR